MSTHTSLVAEYSAAFNRRDTSIYERLFTSDCEVVAPGMRATGVAAMRGFDQAWGSAFSEARIETLRLSETEGAVLASNWFHGGTHTGPLPTPAGPIPATGRQFSAPYCASFEFRDGKISAQRVVFDAESVPKLLGLAPAVVESAAAVVMALYDAFGRGDLAGVLDRVDPGAVLHFEGSAEVPWAGTWRGRDGWARFFQTLGSHVSALTIAMTPFAVDGDRVVAAGRYQGTVAATGARIDSPLVHLWTVRGGCVVDCVELTNTAAEAAACTIAAAATTR